MGLIGMVLTACGGSGESTAVPEGMDGLEHIRTEAVDELRSLAPELARAVTASVQDAQGSYDETGYFGTTLNYRYSAVATLASDEPVREADVRTVLEDRGLDVSASDDPNGQRVILGVRDGLSASVRLEPNSSTMTLTVRCPGADVSQDDLPAPRRAELREPMPIDLG